MQTLEWLHLDCAGAAERAAPMSPGLHLQVNRSPPAGESSRNSSPFSETARCTPRVRSPLHCSNEHARRGARRTPNGKYKPRTRQPNKRLTARLRGPIPSRRPNSCLDLTRRIRTHHPGRHRSLGQGDRRDRLSCGRVTSGLRERSGDKPIIAAVNGACLAAGCELVLDTEIRIAAERAKSGLPEASRGVIPFAGSIARLPRQIPYCVAMQIQRADRG